MGRSSGACFNIMACARDPAEDGGGDAAAEDKVATDKRKWSFRRRSSKHLLSNISISGPLSFDSNSKASPEAGSRKLNEPANHLQTSEKLPTLKLADEKPQLPSDLLDPIISDTIVIDNENKEVDTSYPDAVIIVIQSAARRYLARREFIKLKNVVKLQATVRGYLVRRQAVGTLRCVQAILKLQALVRARPQQCVQKTLNLERVESSGYKQNKLHYSTEKLQANAYSRQLLASTPTKKPIYISCDPSKSASAWLWLERWMTLTSSDTVQQNELGRSGASEYHGENEAEITVSKPSVEVVDLLSSANTEPNVCPSDFPSGALLNGCSLPNQQDPISISTKDFHEPFLEEVSNLNFNVIDREEVTNITSSQITAKSDGNLQTEAYNDKQQVDIEKSKQTMKTMAVDPLESEGKKSVIMPKRLCNPAFAAMQSKFEELSATPNSGRSISSRGSSFNQGAMTETKPDSSAHWSHKSDKSDTLSCELTFTGKADSNFSETTLPHQIQFQTANSECGTEISISSTLDSPDISEPEGGEIVLEIGTLERRHFDADTNSNGICILDQTDAHAKASPGLPGNSERGHAHMSAGTNDMCCHENLKSEPENIPDISEDVLLKMEQADGNSDTKTSYPTPELLSIEQPKLNECKSATEEQEGISSASPEASPRSHITAVESHGTPISQLESHGTPISQIESHATPTSQVSANVTSSKRRTKLLGKKLNSPVAGKKSLSNVKSSGENDSTELLKDSKSMKRRNSLGMVKPDFLDNEPRISSSNSLPNYMQATESAKAKLQAINSPKSSPDVHDKESHTKKRHSLPIGSVKQTSPRMQRSASHVQQSSKDNNKRSPNIAAERKWQR